MNFLDGDLNSVDCYRNNSRKCVDRRVYYQSEGDAGVPNKDGKYEQTKDVQKSGISPDPTAAGGNLYVYAN